MFSDILLIFNSLYRFVFTALVSSVQTQSSCNQTKDQLPSVIITGLLKQMVKYNSYIIVEFGHFRPLPSFDS